MKKILCTILLIMFFIITLGKIELFAYDIKYEEAVEIMKKVPDEISVNIKESEIFILDEDVDDHFNIWYKLNDKIKEIDSKLESYPHIGTLAYYPWVETDIRKATVYIEYGEETLEKEIKINYSNSSDWNEEDNKYVQKIAEETNFHRRWDFPIHEDGTWGEFQDKSDFSWNELIGVDDIKVIPLGNGMGGTEFCSVEGYELLLFKNDVLYQIVDGSIQDTGKIIVPETIKETDEAYIEYAKPIIEKFSNYEYEYNGVTYRNECTIKEMYRTHDDFIQFKIGETEYREYEDGVLVYTETYDWDSTILIAKENEYRFKLVPRLQNVEIIEKQDKTYLKGTMKITETEIGYEVSVNEKYAPEIILIEENNKEYKATVTKGENDTYYFEIEASKLELDKNYKIQARNTSPNNKYPDNNINATLAEGTSIDVSNDEILVKSIVTESVVELSIEGLSEYTLGDISADGKINTKDARLVLLNYVGKQELTANQKEAADVNKDGKINTKDARQILLYYVGKITEFN